MKQILNLNYNNTKTNIFSSLGTHKNAKAKVYFFPGTGIIALCNQPFKNYFYSLFNYTAEYKIIQKLLNYIKKYFHKLTNFHYNIEIFVSGGGYISQLKSIQNALVKLILKFAIVKANFRKLNLVTKDARIKEQKKYSLKKARKAKQYSKR